MSETVTVTATFPEMLMELIRNEQIKIRIDNGIVTLVPTGVPESPMRGFLSDGSGGTRATDEFMRRKQEEKELEL